MFFASVAKPNPDGGEPVDVFAYFLADRLGRTLDEIHAMPHAEYLGWTSYHKIREQRDELAAKRMSHG